ncbi:hypothetical protein NPIL_56411, partial [Nephila pilipes]|jgi:hypothetical protein
LLKT